jgi:cation:H+ antiporter
MTLLLFFILFALGLFLMLYGADKLVSGGSAIAAHFRISPLVIGLTIVSFGTSFPEFAASLVGALHGKTDIAMGNVVGSNICNLGLVLGAAALTRPITVHAGILRKEIPFVLLVSILMWGMVWNNMVGRMEGAILCVLFVLFVWYCIYTARREDGDLPVDLSAIQTNSPVRGAVKVFFGLVLLFAGAELLIRSAVKVAEIFDISQAVIGLTVVALGTSLPELVTSVVALRRGEGDIGLGNVLGSNIFNILFVLGVTSTVHPIPSSAQFFRVDIPIMLLFTLVLVPIARNQMKISRGEGAFLLSGYVGYILFLVLTNLNPV